MSEYVSLAVRDRMYTMNVVVEVNPIRTNKIGEQRLPIDTYFKHPGNTE